MGILSLHQLIQGGESPTVEFKSDRGPLADADLLEINGSGLCARSRPDDP
jgi:hypothetical protein